MTQIERCGNLNAAVSLWLEQEAAHGGLSQGMIYARTWPEMQEVAETCRDLLGPHGGRLDDHAWCFLMPSGARLRFNCHPEEEMACGHGGYRLTMLIFHNMPSWTNHRVPAMLASMVRNADGIRSRIVTVGELPAS